MEVQQRELLGLTASELSHFLESVGEKSYNGKQLYHSIYKRRQFNIGEMTDLSRALRQRLQLHGRLILPRTALSQLSIDGTRKYLFELGDGEKIESVFIPEEQRDTLCISTQVGCPMDCKFCLTALLGLARNLTVGEIVGQVLAILKDRHEPSTQTTRAKHQESIRVDARTVNIVLMGMGEPLLNLDNVSRALILMTDPNGIGIPPHRITLSTVGLVPKLFELAKAPV